MRIKSNLIFFLIGLFFVFYVSLYIFMLDQLSVWINDIKSCYSVMDLPDFFINHLHIFVYLSVLSLMSYGLMRMFSVIFTSVRSIFLLHKDLKKLKKKSLKNLFIIDSKTPLSFTFFNRIVLSDSVIKNLSRNEKKAVFYHELGHLKNYDSIKFLLGDIFLSVLPENIKTAVKNQLITFCELSADKFALNIVSERELLGAVVKLKEIRNNYPQGASFIEERFSYILENKNPQINKTVLVMQIIPAVLFIITFVYRTCFCGAM
ncbi:M48 family metalloprotease [Persephonella sp.]